MVATIKETGKKVHLRRFKDGTFGTWEDNKIYTEEDLIFPSTNKKEFLKDLKALLEKYNASITWTCSEGSDTYGIHDAHLCANLNDKEDIEFGEQYIDCNTLYTL